MFKRTNSWSIVTDENIDIVFRESEKYNNDEISEKEYTDILNKNCTCFTLEGLLLWNYDYEKMVKILSNENYIKSLRKLAKNNEGFLLCNIRHISSFICCPETTLEEIKIFLDMLFNCNYPLVSWMGTRIFCDRKYKKSDFTLDSPLEGKNSFLDYSRLFFDYFISVHVSWMLDLCNKKKENIKSIFDWESIKKMIENTEIVPERESDYYISREDKMVLSTFEM